MRTAISVVRKGAHTLLLAAYGLLLLVAFFPPVSYGTDFTRSVEVDLNTFTTRHLGPELMGYELSPNFVPFDPVNIQSGDTLTFNIDFLGNQKLKLSNSSNGKAYEAIGVLLANADPSPVLSSNVMVLKFKELEGDYVSDSSNQYSSCDTSCLSAYMDGDLTDSSFSFGGISIIFRYIQVIGSPFIISIDRLSNLYALAGDVRVVGTPINEKKVYGIFIGVYDGLDGQIRDAYTGMINPLMMGYHGDLMAQDLQKVFKNNVDFAEVALLDGTETSGGVDIGRVLDQIDTFAAKMDDNDILVIFISAHGGVSEWELQLDETTLTKGDEFVYLGRWQSGFLGRLSDDELTGRLLKATSQNNFETWIFIDSCRSGGFWGDNGPDDSGDLKRLNKVGLIASGAEDKDPLYNTLTGRGFLGDALIKAFTRSINSYGLPSALNADLNKDYVLSFAELVEYVNSWWQFEFKRLKNTSSVLLGGYAGIQEDGTRAGLAVPLEISSFMPEGYTSEEFSETIGGGLLAVIKTDSDDNKIVKCTNSEEITIALDGSGSANPGDGMLTYTWTGPFGTLTGDVVTATLPIGTHTITLTVDDGQGNTDSTTIEVTVNSCELTCDITGDGKHDGRDVAEFQKGCKAGTATWLCDVSGDNRYDGRDVAEYQKQCLKP